MISISVIECTEVDLIPHFHSNGTLINIGGIGQTTVISIWDSIIGTRLDSITMEWDGLIVGITEDGHLINGVMDMDGITITDGVMDMDGTTTDGITDTEEVVM